MTMFSRPTKKWESNNQLGVSINGYTQNCMVFVRQNHSHTWMVFVRENPTKLGDWGYPHDQRSLDATSTTETPQQFLMVKTMGSGVDVPVRTNPLKRVELTVSQGLLLSNKGMKYLTNDG